STAAHQSDHIFKACGTPVFFPASVQEILDLGLHAFALSRYAGVWAGMKTIQEIVESSASVWVDPDRVKIQLPTDFEMPPGGIHIRWPDAPLEQEARLLHTKWYAALAYIRANRLNYNVISGPQDRFGLIASGKAYNDTRQALQDLGLDDDACRGLGIRLHKVGVVWPLEAQLAREFATGLQEILVVEEKRQVIEYQLKEELYNWRDDVRPNILGKFDEAEGDRSGGEWSQSNPSGRELLRANADLSPAMIARAIAGRLKKLGLLEAAGSDIAARVQSQLAILDAKERSMQVLTLGGVPAVERQPWFCSGCPHNTSTRVPEGSRAMAGIGCHFMAVWMDRATIGFTQMGGEGAPWVGQQPFSHEKHVFANLGDGTYFHSGILAVRQAVAAGVNITYKILYNDAVAMTGGQKVGERPEGHSVLQIAHSMRAEGAKKITVVTDEPQKYQGLGRDGGVGGSLGLPAGVSIEHRDRLDVIQREFREIEGTTVIIYDQTCATEKRRRRKRGLMVDPAVRVLINEAVCEGCGDCSEKSNCLSVEPLETEFGRKRTINQSSCNKDMSCLKGFCPSFVTVEGGQLKKKSKTQALSPQAAGPLPEPVLPVLAGAAYGIVVAGVGGTGVITIGQLLGMAAHIEGKGIVTQDAAGLAQKGGATWSHVLIAQTPQDIRTTRVSMAAADLILGCDPIVTAGKETLLRMREGRTRVALNGHSTPTAAFVKNSEWQNPAARCVEDIVGAVGAKQLGLFDADALALRALGDSIYVNPLVLGYAWQKGWIPLRQESVLRAIELNGVAVESNKAAFAWGRQAAHDEARVQQVLAPAQVVELKPRETLDDMVARRVEYLGVYQDAAYAEDYRLFVEQVRVAEAPLQRTRLAEAVARNLFKLMAYKDEYEVARLHRDPDFLARIDAMFEGDYRVHYHLAPPLLARKNERGELVKRKFGPWMGRAFGLLARLKRLRGTAFDPFGHTEERRAERALIAEYKAMIHGLLQALNEGNADLALEIAQLPGKIRGFGHVKAAHLAAARQRWAQLQQQFGQATPAPRQAA
ncbi:MAG: indolepyruvate ferredoxin oxidoreductase family protein, partial [Hylemonella sp.]|nr:indolepyruvate ferredoxin oxidoreductase family protein [Hylemonella sp.]